MAEDYIALDKSEPKEPKTSTKDENGVCKQALERYNLWYQRESDNVTNAYADLNFCWDDKQWDAAAAADRKAEDRPCLVANLLPQFIHQVTGDMRQMQPGIQVIPVDSAGDKKTAEAVGGMVRYIENRSHATRIYTAGADSQVSCGIGAWRVTKERGDTTFNQELRIVGIDDAVAIAVDPDSIIPTREDAKWMIVPVDMSRESFKEKYPGFSVEEFDTSIAHSTAWFDGETIRVAEYWVKKPMKRTLALLPDGAVVDLTGKDEAERAEIKVRAAKVEDRDSHQVCRYMITAAHVLEEDEWPGMHIPIAFAVGEEIKIGRKVIRRGLVRSAKDPQRMFNFYCSAEAEALALAPKAPFIATDKNVRQNQAMWASANKKAHPALIYEPDPANGGIPPQRVQAGMAVVGISEAKLSAAENMKRVIGIYDASLGARSNETSGKAIEARQREGDTGSYVYIDNWTLAIAHTGTILVDLIPHTYDTERQIRIMGEDGKIDLKWINKPIGMQVQGPDGQMMYQGPDGQMQQQQPIENDVTQGAYDVVLKTGPSYMTKRQEAKDGMIEFIRSAPETAPVVMDLVAKAQDWPLADEFAKRLEAVAPGPIQKLIAQQKQERGEEEPPQQPDPQQQMAQQMAQLELQGKALENEKLKAETAKLGQPEQGDPLAGVKIAGEQQKLQIDAHRATLDHSALVAEIEAKQRLAEVELEIKLADLAIKKQGLQLDTAAAALDLQGKQQGLAHDAEEHTAGLVQSFEKHDSSLTQSAEAHAAKVKQMNKPRPSAN